MSEASLDEAGLPAVDDGASYRLASWLFPRLLGAIYCVAFGSLWVQVEGLLGSRGILPVADYLQRAAEVLGAERFWWLPTVFWLGHGDGALQVVCALGCLAGALALLGRLQTPALLACWALYLSLVSVGQDFLSFQWDVLLLETGLLAVLASPPGLRARLADAPEPPALPRWLLWLLLLRLYVLSGLVKLASGDPTWRDLTALTYHYETQPLPTWIGWWAHQLPAAVQRASALGMFVVELGVPWLLFSGRRWRRRAALVMAALQATILLTGNYTFFNLLTIALCLLWIDDDAWPSWLRRRLGPPAPQVAGGGARSIALRTWRRMVTGAGWCLALLALLVTVSGAGMGRLLPRPALVLLQWSRPFRSVSSYGLFAVMTTSRPEIVIEGSDDGIEWTEYRFPWKPGATDRRPRFVAPHQPRLDWQLWFAALAGYGRTPWFPRFMERLLEGSPAVLGLLAENPFPEAPPRYLRARLYDYRFTDVATRRATGRWWSRTLLGPYGPVLSRPGPAAAGRTGRAASG